MPNKKNTKPNGFFMFMIDERKRLQAANKRAYSMGEMSGLCSEMWKNLSATEKARYDSLAKQEKGRPSHDQETTRHRLDNQGQIISERKSGETEKNKRQIRENQDLLKSWEGRDIKDIKFHVINFQVMYPDEPVDFFLPMEVGIVCFTLRDGITQSMHNFIDPGDAPKGSRHLALSHSESTHKIPLRFKEASSDLTAIWTHIQTFLMEDVPLRGEIPPLFCMSHDQKFVESGLEFLYHYSQTRDPNRLTKIYSLEELVVSLMLQSELVNRRPSVSQVKDSLLRNQWDYLSSIRCSYHDEVDCSYCSLAIVKRLCFSMFDILSKLLDFELTVNHMPDETGKNKFVVTYPSSSSTSSRMDERGFKPTQRRGNRTEPGRFSTSAVSSLSSSSSSPQAQASQPMSYSQLFNTSKSHSGQIRKSDSEGEDDYDNNVDDDDDDDEIKSTSEKYKLRELRKPQFSAMVMSNQVFQAYGRGLGIPSGTAVPPTGNQIQTEGQNRIIQPPPGFGPRIGSVAGTVPRYADFVQPGAGTPETQVQPTQESNFSTQDFPHPQFLTGPAQPSSGLPSRGVGLPTRGVGRGRGMPPQVRTLQQQGIQ